MDANATVPGGAAPAYALALWNLVIRPPRCTYDTTQLGPSEFMVRGVRGSRQDFRLRTSRGSQLACSHFSPVQATRGRCQQNPVVVYLHGNASCRLEAAGLVGQFLERHISLFCFDAAGCGLSEGEYVSLGWHERDDLATVIAHLRESPFCGPIGVWGRSMGAVTALLHAGRDPSLGAMCLDSPFACLRQLMEELAQSTRVAVPSWLLSAALAVVRMRVKALADFDIDDVAPLGHVGGSYMPALFMHARSDTFVMPQHSEKLFAAYAGANKQLFLFDGNHNSLRREEVVTSGVGFFCRSFRECAQDLELPARIMDAEPAVPRQNARPRSVPRLPLSSTVSGHTKDAWRSGKDTWHRSVPRLSLSSTVGRHNEAVGPPRTVPWVPMGSSRGAPGDDSLGVAGTSSASQPPLQAIRTMPKMVQQPAPPEPPVCAFGDTPSPGVAVRRRARARAAAAPLGVPAAPAPESPAPPSSPPMSDPDTRRRISGVSSLVESAQERLIAEPGSSPEPIHRRPRSVRQPCNGGGQVSLSPAPAGAADRPGPRASCPPTRACSASPSLLPVDSPSPLVRPKLHLDFESPQTPAARGGA